MWKGRSSVEEGISYTWKARSAGFLADVLGLLLRVEVLDEWTEAQAEDVEDGRCGVLVSAFTSRLQPSIARCCGMLTTLDSGPPTTNSSASSSTQPRMFAKTSRRILCRSSSDDQPPSGFVGFTGGSERLVSNLSLWPWTTAGLCTMWCWAMLSPDRLLHVWYKSGRLGGLSLRPPGSSAPASFCAARRTYSCSATATSAVTSR